jgi:hypothetical protein
VRKDGTLVWICDAYTITDRYPYSEPSRQGISYIRNSVKAVVDAYDGTVTFYVVDDADPMIRAYMAAFPDMFTPASEVPEDLAAHFRHPEDLFRIQTQLFRSYHTTDPEEFFSRSEQWQLAADPRTGQVDDPDTPVVTSNTTVQTAGGQSLVEVDEDDPMNPEYLMMQLPDDDALEFVLVQPFVPVNTESQNLTSLLVARNDGPNRGRLVSYEMPNGVEGPATVDFNIRSDNEISTEITNLARLGSGQSQVVQGALQPYLVGGSVVYVRPVYLRASGSSSLPALAFVIAYNDRRVVRGDTIDEALDNLSAEIRAGGGGPDEPPDDTGTGGDGTTTTSTAPGSTTGSTTQPDEPSPASITDPQEALDRAIDAGDDARAADAQGNNTEYLRLLELSQAYLDRYRDLLAASSTSAPTATSTTSDSTSTTASTAAPPATDTTAPPA